MLSGQEKSRSLVAGEVAEGWARRAPESDAGAMAIHSRLRASGRRPGRRCPKTANVGNGLVPSFLRPPQVQRAGAGSGRWQSLGLETVEGLHASFIVTVEGGYRPLAGAETEVVTGGVGEPHADAVEINSDPLAAHQG